MFFLQNNLSKNKKVLGKSEDFKQKKAKQGMKDRKINL